MTSKERWFALVDTEQVICLGEHEDFGGADEAAETKAPCAVWIFTETGLRRVIESAAHELGEIK